MQRVARAVPPFSLIVITLAAWACFAAAEKQVALKELRITRQIECWKEQKKSFVKFDHEKLFELINGGAELYIDNGLVEGIFQRLAGPGETSAEVYTEEFASPAHAQKMLALKAQRFLEPVTVVGLDSANVRSFAVIGGYQTYAAFGRFYIELTLTGAPSRREGLAHVSNILRWLRAKALPG